MGLCMEAAAENHKMFFVLDRVNPINAATVDGPVLVGATSFVGFHPLPLRMDDHGELARMFKAERKCDVDLRAIALENWKRDAWFDETGQPWTNPSPNLTQPHEAILYPGSGCWRAHSRSAGH